MPWTRRQVRYLLSSGSPLTAKQRGKMLDELHENPALGHAKKKKPPKPRARTRPLSALGADE